MKLTAGTLVTRINEIQEFVGKNTTQKKGQEEMKLTAGTLVTRINEIQEFGGKKTTQQKGKMK